jgi:hypothetical protein
MQLTDWLLVEVALLHACASGQYSAKPFFASTLREQLFELKIEDAIKIFENLRDTYASKAYPLSLCTAQSNLLRQFLQSMTKKGIESLIPAAVHL